MQYKTIVLELIQQQTELHERLRTSRKLLSTLDQLATQLRDHHLSLTRQLTRQNPQLDQMQALSETLEVAVKHLEEALTQAAEPSGSELSLDEAIAYLQQNRTG